MGKIFGKIKKYFTDHKAMFFSILILFVLYIGHKLYYLYKYSEYPLYKKDQEIRNIIEADFPAEYDVTIITANLTGVGEGYYVAYGNSKTLKYAFMDSGDCFLLDEHASNDFTEKYETNNPVIKIYYVQDVGLVKSLVSLVPFVNGVSDLFSISLKTRYVYSPVPVYSNDISDIVNLNDYYRDNFSGGAAFFLSNVEVADVDNDHKDEIITEWIFYQGAVLGIKWSIIIEEIDGIIHVSSGFPDMFVPEITISLWAILKNSNRTDHKEFNKDRLEYLCELLALDYDVISDKHVDEDKFMSELVKLKSEAPYVYFINRNDKSKVVTYERCTDYYDKFVKVDDFYVFVDAVPVLDKDCHWCPKDWRLMAFRYNDGRWISDRVVNGPFFEGSWLDLDRMYDIEEVHGTIQLQNIMGIDPQFFSPLFTCSAQQHISDPTGKEMRMPSPVQRRVKELYDNIYQ